jgi:hypothetical protein
VAVYLGMTTTLVVRYETTPATADENARLVAAVYAELAHQRPDGLQYATFRLDDGVTFVHVAVRTGDVDPLPELPAFQEFQRTIAARVVAPPNASPATIVGSYGLF